MTQITQTQKVAHQSALATIDSILAADSPYRLFLELGLSFLVSFINKLTKSNAPGEVITAFRAAYDALVSHRNDVVTKAALEAQRG